MQPRSLSLSTGLRWVLWLAIGGVVATLVFGTATRGTVLAVPATTSLHQTPPISWDNMEFWEDEEECDELGLAPGEVFWHFVLVQTSASSATLHATFDGAGDISVVSYKKSGNVLHFAITTGQDTLLGAHVNAAGRWLNLSHICAGPPVTTTTTTTTTTSTSTSTTSTTTSTETSASGS